MPELDPLFAELRREYEPDPEARHRVRQRVAAAVAVGSVFVTSSAAASLAGTGSAGVLAGKALGGSTAAKSLGLTVLSWSAGAKLSALAGVGLAASLAGGVVWNEINEPLATQVSVSDVSEQVEPLVQRARGVHFRAPTDLRAAPASTPRLEATPSKQDDSSGIIASEAPSVAKSGSMSHTPRSSEVLEDLRLLQQASQALRAGNAGQARALLDEHERRFPRSVVRQERTGLGLLVRCSATAGASVRADAERFLKTQPNSPLAEHVRKQCLP
jgi:hypothetical protein